LTHAVCQLFFMPYSLSWRIWVEQARQQRTHATGREHVFANAVLVTGRLIDRVALVGDDFGRVLDRHGRMV